MKRQPEPRRALVTGCAGFIGSHLSERLLADGWEVVGVDCFTDYYDRGLKDANLAGAAAHERFTLVEDDLLALPLQDLLPAGVVVYHLAAQAGVRASWGESFAVYTENNIRATQLLLEAARGRDVARFVYASSSSVYGDTPALPMREDAECRPVSPYGVTKLAAEHLCGLYHRSFGVPAVSLRFFTVYGPRQRPDMAFNRFIRALLAGEPLGMYGEGGQTRDFTYVDDIVEALVCAGSAEPGAVVNVGGGARVTLREAIGILGELAGREPLIDVEGEQPGDVRHTWADLSRARELLGYAPRVSLREGLAAQYAWQREPVTS